MRKEIAYDKRNCIIESFWGICKEKNLDLAHIPYMLRSSFLDKNIQYQFTCHSRNPYDRIISAYFCLNPEKTIADFHYFCENVLSSYDFHMCFEKSSNDCNQQTEGDLPSDISGSSTFIDHKILNNSFNKDYIHYYPQYLFVCDENEQISNHTKISKIEDCANSKKYPISIYFTNEILQIINRIYEKDFYFFGYSLQDEIL